MTKDQFKKFYKVLLKLYPKQIHLEDTEHWWKALHIYDYDRVIEGLKEWRKIDKVPSPGVVEMCFHSDLQIRSVVSVIKQIAEAVITGSVIDDPQLMKIVDEHKKIRYVIIARDLDKTVMALRETMSEIYGWGYVILFQESRYVFNCYRYGKKADYQTAKGIFFREIFNEVYDLLLDPDISNLDPDECDELDCMVFDAVIKETDTIESFDSFDFCKLYKIIDPRNIDVDNLTLEKTDPEPGKE